MASSWKPTGHHDVTAYLLVPDIEKEIAFLVAAFGGEETFRTTAPNGRVAHAMVRIGDSVVMMGTPPEPKPTMLYLYAESCDTAYAQALRAGATSVQEPATQMYGDRTAAIIDVGGNTWYIATHLEDLSAEEIDERYREAASKS